MTTTPLDNLNANLDWLEAEGYLPGPDGLSELEAVAADRRAKELADLSFWLDGVRFWAVILDGIEDHHEDAAERRRKAIQQIKFCHSVFTEKLNASDRWS